MHPDPEFIPFSEVIDQLKENPAQKFARDGWNGKHQYITMCDVGTVKVQEEKFVVRPFLAICTNPGADPATLVPWLASQTDILADDWFDVTECYD